MHLCKNNLFTEYIVWLLIYAESALFFLIYVFIHLFIYLFIYYHYYYYFIFFTIFVSWKKKFSTLKTHKTFNIIARYYSRQNTFRNCLLRVCLVKNCWQNPLRWSALVYSSTKICCKDVWPYLPKMTKKRRIFKKKI